MSEIKIRLPAPFPAQTKILNRASRYNAVCMGESGGKTTLGIVVLIASKDGALSGKHPVACAMLSASLLVICRHNLSPSMLAMPVVISFAMALKYMTDASAMEYHSSRRVMV